MKKLFCTILLLCFVIPNLSLPVLATEENTFTAQTNTEERGFVIKDGAVYDLSGKFLFNISADGQLDNGQFLSEDFTVHYGKSSWAIEDINNAIDAGIVPVLLRYGYEENINREDFSVIAYNMLDKSEMITISTTDAPAKFADTDSDEIKILARMGIIAGKSESEFAPDANITREEAATILARIADYVKLSDGSGDTSLYDDNNNISDWAIESVYKIKKLGIMQGEVIYNGDEGSNEYTSLFNPRSEITKEESIVTLMRIYDMIK